MPTLYPSRSLEEYLHSVVLTVDSSAEDGWGVPFPVKGKELEAVVLFADITSFSRRTMDLSPTETLIFVNHFFTWITEEAVKDKPCIIDKYIGDEIMLIFSTEFGSKDATVDAIRTATRMTEFDEWGFCPHVGIAGGLVVAGCVGTSLKHQYSVFGKPVTLASRCASVKSEIDCSSHIAFPVDLWKGDDISVVSPAVRLKNQSTGEVRSMPQDWEFVPPRTVHLKNIGNIAIREMVNRTTHWPSQSPEDYSREVLELLEKEGKYKK